MKNWSERVRNEENNTVFAEHFITFPHPKGETVTKDSEKTGKVGKNVKNEIETVRKEENNVLCKNT